MYLRATTTYGSLIPGSEYIRSLVRQGTISPAAAALSTLVLCRRRGRLAPSYHRPDLSFMTWAAQAKKFKTQGMISS
jgi:hypothetical protein